jgi:zinc D-Ala-D-Ala carboxypeptidase
MMKLSPHFTLAEMTVSQTAARAGIDNTPPPPALGRLRLLCALLERVRTHLGAPIIVLSGYRSGKVNALVRGSPTSQHMKGEAADFIAPKFGPPLDICAALVDSGLDYDQLILEFADSKTGGWVHISVADDPRGQALAIDRSGTKMLFGQGAA